MPDVKLRHHISKKRVGTNHSGYPEHRNIIDVPHRRYIVEKCYNVFKLLDHFFYKTAGKSIQLFHNSHVDIGHAKVDLYHFFNGISLSSTPWVTTFETSLPRLGNAPEIFYRYYLRALRGDSCKRLIAMSEHARNNMLRYLDGVSEDVRNEVVNKLTVLHPPQAPLLQSVAEKRCPSDRIVFTIIGHAFFLKGGGRSCGHLMVCCRNMMSWSCASYRACNSVIMPARRRSRISARRWL